jgi:hypothetical protein
MPISSLAYSGSGMKVKFQADADLDGRIIRGLKRRLPEIEILTADQANLAGLSDPEVLEVASLSGRILVTHDHHTMPGHFGQFIASRNSSGVIVVPKSLPIGTAIEELSLIWLASDAAEWPNRLMWIPL